MAGQPKRNPGLSAFPLDTEMLTVGKSRDRRNRILFFILMWLAMLAAVIIFWVLVLWGVSQFWS